MKKLLIVFAAVLFLTACTADNREKKYFCREIGFDKSGQDILITASFSSAGKDTPEKDGRTVVVMTAKDPEEAVKMLLDNYGKVLYKPLETMFFGESLDKETKNELLSLFVNHCEFQLKCDVAEKENANLAITEKEDKSGTEKEGKQIFSEYYRKNFNKGETDE